MIQVTDLTVQNGSFVIEDVQFVVPHGVYGVLMGKTGSGKTTLLEAICGLKRVISGRIVLGDDDVSQHSPAQRGIGFVPQDGALFDSMSVRNHLEFALKIRKWSRSDTELRVKELARLLQIEKLLDRRPYQLSGGERQRVALGRALSFHPKILCLDEPLSALDDDTRSSMVELLKHVQSETGVTALHVTHNRLEAEALAGERLFIEAGRVRRDWPGRGKK